MMSPMYTVFPGDQPYTNRQVCKLNQGIDDEGIMVYNLPWWRHQMEIFSASLALCAGNSPVIGEFPSQSPVTRSFDVFYDLSMNKRLSIQSWGWWFETPSRSLWRHCNDTLCFHFCKSRPAVICEDVGVTSSATCRFHILYTRCHTIMQISGAEWL